MASRIPQIITLAREKKAGVLSFIAVLLNFLGTCTHFRFIIVIFQHDPVFIFDFFIPPYSFYDTSMVSSSDPFWGPGLGRVICSQFGSRWTKTFSTKWSVITSISQMSQIWNFTNCFDIKQWSDRSRRSWCGKRVVLVRTRHGSLEISWFRFCWTLWLLRSGSIMARMVMGICACAARGARRRPERRSSRFPFRRFASETRNFTFYEVTSSIWINRINYIAHSFCIHTSVNYLRSLKSLARTDTVWSYRNLFHCHIHFFVSDHCCFAIPVVDFFMAEEEEIVWILWWRLRRVCDFCVSFEIMYVLHTLVFQNIVFKHATRPK